MGENIYIYITSNSLTLPNVTMGEKNKLPILTLPNLTKGQKITYSNVT